MSSVQPPTILTPASYIVIRRGGNRTPTSGFGDRSSTTKLLSYGETCAPQTGAANFLFQNFRNNTGADGAPPFTDREADIFLHRNRRNEFDLEFHIVAGHTHFGIPK